MLSIGVLASTKASDMQAIIDSIENKELSAGISVVISNKKDAYALERAKSMALRLFLLIPRARKGKNLTKKWQRNWMKAMLK